MPRFSIVIPTYNRERLLARAIDSCLRQTYTDFEVIVSDDGSTDGSRALVERYADPRVRFLRCDRNRGIGPARNAGVDAASGEWIVFLDSDDELLPDALATMNRCAAQVAPGVGRMVFMYQLDIGGYSPNPSLVPAVWDYVGYLQWLESLRGSSDYCNCIRRKTFETVRWAEDRAFEGGYLLNLSLHFRTQAFPDVVGVVHSDADNRSTAWPLEVTLQWGADNAAWADRNLARHEAGMAAHCPTAYRRFLQVFAISYFLSGDRRKGWKTVWKIFRLRPTAWRAWALMTLGVCGPRTFGRLIGLKAWHPFSRWIPGARNKRTGSMATGCAVGEHALERGGVRARRAA